MFVHSGFARQTLGAQTLPVFIKSLLRGFMIAHRLFGCGATLGVARLAHFGCQDSGRLCGGVIVHAPDNATDPKKFLTGTRELSARKAIPSLG